MKNLNKFSAVFLLVLISIYFSGCTISKVDNGGEIGLPVLIEEEDEQVIDPDQIDTDGDGLLDKEEQDYGTSIYKLDSDVDGLTDFEEVKTWKTDPMNPDTDGDSYKDGEEVAAGYDPLTLGQLDTDGDGIGDVDEKRLGTDPEIYNK